MGGAQGFGMMPAMDAPQDITVIAFLVDKIDQELKVEARFDFVNADSATQTGGTIDGLLKLASAFAPDESVQSLLNNLELFVEGNTLTLSF
jgi:hypothetical protein